jgi:hypothetical protein
MHVVIQLHFMRVTYSPSIILSGVATNFTIDSNINSFASFIAQDSLGLAPSSWSPKAKIRVFPKAISNNASVSQRSVLYSLALYNHVTNFFTNRFDCTNYFFPFRL